MKIVDLSDKKGKKAFLSFRRNLYRGDGEYVMTSEFPLTDLLYGISVFARECFVRPVAVTSDGGEILAEAMLIFNDKLPLLQVSFFEALPDVREAVDLLISEAGREARKKGVQEVVVGLNAHISYGVGILTEGFGRKISLDSIYNKPYYRDYFAGMRKETLSAYRGEKAETESKLTDPLSPITVCKADMKRFREETERMRAVCEKTIAKTFLYYRTEKDHFYHLMRDLKPFLSGENLLFAVNAKGEDVGFLFWHPDFNQMLKGGRNYTAAGIALAKILHGRKIDTAKLNAIGCLSPSATAALLSALNGILKDRYRHLETNFVWDNNLRSGSINRHFFHKPFRKYEVFFTDV